MDHERALLAQDIKETLDGEFYSPSLTRVRLTVDGDVVDDGVGVDGGRRRVACRS